MGLYVYRLPGPSLAWLGRWQGGELSIQESLTSATVAHLAKRARSRISQYVSYTLLKFAASVLASGGRYAACTGQLLESSPYRSLHGCGSANIQTVRTTRGNEGIYQFQCTGLISWSQLEVCPSCQVLALAPHVL